MVASVPSGWGEWLLDDLAFVAKKASRLVGPSEEVTEVRVRLTGVTSSAVMPTVVLLVPTPEVAERMRHRLLHGEYVVDVYEPLFGDSWQAEVNGIVIRIETEAA